MKKILCLVSLLFFLKGYSQQSFNISLLAHWNDSTLNRCDADQIWNDLTGWKDTIKNREYIIAGSCDSIYFFDITDPNKIIKVDVEEGHSRNSVNRDYDTYSHYVYCVSDRSSPVGSLQIFDLQYLPDSVHKVYDDDQYSINTHTLFIEQKSKRLYLGADLHKPVSGVTFSSMYILSLANPEVPVLLGEIPSSALCSYTHEVFVRNDTAYCSCGDPGLFIYDVRNAANPVLISSIVNYPKNGYNHSSWLDSSGKYLMFSDEVPFGLLIKIYDISDIQNPKLVSMFNSNAGATPHNAYWKGKFAWVSHYEDGVRVWDISDPYHPVVAGYYDTYMQNAPGTYNGFHGCWGVYPFLPSGNIIASDISEGLFVLKPSPTLGVKQVENSFIDAAIYPNPADQTSKLSINSDEVKTIEIIVFNMTGKLIASKKMKLGYGSNEILLSELFKDHAGLYIIQISDQHASWSSRILKR